MIDSLVTLLFPLTLLLIILLVGRKWLLSSIGASNTYLLWLVIPLGLIFYSLPFPWQQHDIVNVLEIKRYLVNPTIEFQQSITSSWIFNLWLSIAVSMLVYWVFTYFTFYKNTCCTLLDKSMVPLALPKNLPLYTSSNACSPMLIGLIEQKLIIPENFFELYSVEQQKLILEHEICHFDRNDIYWNLVAITCLTFFWFHPLAWLAYFRFRQDQELSCDQLVLARKPTESRINYGKALLVAAQSTPSLVFAQIPFTKYGDRQTMLERINSLKATTKTSKSILVVVLLTTITLLSGFSYAGNQHNITKDKLSETIELQPVMRVEPKYPFKAAQDKIEGSVVLKFDVTATGLVENVEVINAKPAYVFDKAAVTALKQWKYSAIGRIVKSNLVQLDFAMDEGSNHENLIERIRVTK